MRQNEPEQEVIDEPDPEPELIVSYWDLCRSSSEAYPGAIVIFASYEDSLIPEAAWRVWPVADISEWGRFTGIWRRGMLFSFQWSWFEFCCIYPARATSDWSITEVSFTFTTVAQAWCISLAFLTTTLSWLMRDVLQFYPVVHTTCYTALTRDECF